MPGVRPGQHYLLGPLRQLLLHRADKIPEDRDYLVQVLTTQGGHPEPGQEAHRHAGQHRQRQVDGCPQQGGEQCRSHQQRQRAAVTVGVQERPGGQQGPGQQPGTGARPLAQGDQCQYCRTDPAKQQAPGAGHGDHQRLEATAHDE